jgi:hypothetical protein
MSRRGSPVGQSIEYRGTTLNSTVTADARFLRRVFLGLVVVTAVAGGLAAYTTVQAKNALHPEQCVVLCE